jgi:two-component system, sensor histidine kinase and response regulator
MDLNNLFILNILNSGISLIMGFYMLFLQRNFVKLGTGYWGAGALIVGVGLFFKAIAPDESFFAMVGAPIFNTFGLYLYLAGIWKFKEKRINKWIVIGFPVFDVVQSIIFFNIFQLLRIQIGIHMLILIAYCGLAIYEMIRLNTDQKYLRKIFLLNALSFIIFMVLLLLNVSVVIINPDFKPFEITNTTIIIHIISGLTMIALTFGFLTAANIRLNRELEDQIKSNTKFLSIIAHDLRGPVGNITNFLDLLQNETGLSEEKRREYIKVINVLSQSTFHLLQNLLEWATKSKNLNEFESERIDLSRLISDSMDSFKSSAFLKSIDFKLNMDKQVYISGNTNMLQTIVRNLVSNAIKYTPKGEAISITTEKSGKRARLIVADTGQGIQPEIINSLFKFESSTSVAGTNGEIGSGLGLVLCKELTSRMNGTIEVESQVGVGTKVIVTFPSAE